MNFSEVGISFRCVVRDQHYTNNSKTVEQTLQLSEQCNCNIILVCLGSGALTKSEQHSKTRDIQLTVT